MPGTFEALVIIALVTTPGYICGKLLNRISPFEQGKSDFVLVIQTIAWGTVVHVLMSWQTVEILRWYRHNRLDDHPGAVVWWGVLVVFVVPCLVGAGSALFIKLAWVDRLLDKIGLGYVDRTPTAWDFVMRQERPSFIKATLRDGSKVGGKYSSKSFVSLVPGRTDLFIEETWKLDDETDAFLGHLPDTLGTWIAHDSLVHLEFFDAGDRNEGGPLAETNSGSLKASGEATIGQRETGSSAEARVRSEATSSVVRPASIADGTEARPAITESP